MNTFKTMFTDLNNFFRNSSSNAVIVTIAIGLSVAADFSGIMGSIMNSAVWVVLTFAVIDKFNIRDKSWFPKGDGNGQQSKTNQTNQTNQTGTDPNYTST